MNHEITFSTLCCQNFKELPKLEQITIFYVFDIPLMKQIIFHKSSRQKKLSQINNYQTLPPTAIQSDIQ